MAKRSSEKSSSDYPFSKINGLLNKFSSYKNFRSSKTFYVVLIIAGLLLLAVYKKNWIVAATVNGSPISNLELQSKLNQQFRSKTLDQLVTEKVILDEARKNNAVPTETEIDGKIKEIEAQVGGAQTLDSLLAQQGQTRSSVKDSIRIQLAMTKLYEKEVQVTPDEVNQFVEQNKEQMTASDSAGQQKEAFEAIKGQKLSQMFSQKFQNLKTKAKIQLF